jgi:hypothetical protein
MQITTSAGTQPMIWTIDNGNLPRGLSINAATGLISGIPEVAGWFDFTVKAANGAGSSQQPYSLGIADGECNMPVITITGQPAASTTVTQGSISGNLSVSANVAPAATLTYQWYKNTSNSNTGGTPEPGATGATFTIPASLGQGTHYFYCQVSSAGATSKFSNVATVTVNFINNLETVTTTSLKVYPNPAASELYIELASPETVDYAIYNNVGQAVLQGKLQGDSTINVQSLAGGIYYLRIQGKTVKVIKN